MTKQNKKTAWRDVYKTDHIGAADFDDARDTPVILEKAWKEEVTSEGGRKDLCVVAQFKGYDRPAVLNVTACKQIQQFTGTRYIDEWRDIPLAIYVTETSHKGDTVPCWRIRPRQPKIDAEKEEMTPIHPKWDDVVKKMSNGAVSVETIRKHYILSDENEQALLDEADVPEAFTESKEEA